MAQVDRQLIEALSKLCRIRCDEEEKRLLIQDFERIIDYIDQLGEMDTDGVLPCNNVIEGMVNVFASDEVEPSMPRETFLSLTSNSMGGMVRVPPVIRSE